MAALHSQHAVIVLPGSRLGPYEIVASIGAGGMGEVFRARDTRLNRDVAVKVLPADFAASAQLHARFDREAKAIAALNHPNICTLHDVGREEETHYLVMELVEGESLVDRLRRGPLSMPEVLRYGQQIASALDKAHRQGIIHRDLKPGNIMLTKSGAKLLDFGLAKISEASPVTRHSSLTAQKPITEQGAILGTFQYMAPEQLEGLEADARTDIFALGALLYEMATGNRAFQGSSRTSLIASIVASQPQPISELLPMTPPAFEHVVRRCLEKNPDDRWQSAQDVASELQWVSESSLSGVRALPGVPGRAWRRIAVPGFIAVALVAGAAAGWSLRKPAAIQSSTPVVRSQVPLPAGIRLAGWGPPSIAISPDGQTIAYAGIDDAGKQHLYIRELSRRESVAVAGSESAEGPFFSPDGKWVGFAVAVSGMAVDVPPELRKVSIAGGLPQTICPLEDFFGATWAGDDSIYFVNGASRGLWKVAAAGGVPALVSEKNLDIGFPSALPDGKGIVAVVGGKIALVDPRNGKVEELPVSGMIPSYAATGHILYTGWDRRLTAVPFDLQSGKVTGGAAALVDDIAITGVNGPVYALSKSGTLIYVQGFVSGSTRELSRLVRVSRSGTPTPLPFPLDTYSRRGVSVSRDGSRAAVTMWDGKVWICDLKRGTHLPLPHDGGVMRVAPLWTPDSKSVVFTAFGAGIDAMHIYMQPVDGSAPARQLTSAFERPFEAWPTGWLDDDTVLFNHFSGAAPAVGAVSISGGQQPRALLRQEGMWHGHARVSADRRWIVYEARERDRKGLYIRRADLGGEAMLVAQDGSDARWSADGKEIVFRIGDRLFATPFGGADLGEARELFKIERLKTFDIIPGSSDFVMIVEEPDSGVQTRLSMVQGWLGSELK